jgi:hypothetical protein
VVVWRDPIRRNQDIAHPAPEGSSAVVVAFTLFPRVGLWRRRRDQDSRRQQCLINRAGRSAIAVLTRDQRVAPWCQYHQPTNVLNNLAAIRSQPGSSRCWGVGWWGWTDVDEAVRRPCIRAKDFQRRRNGDASATASGLPPIANLRLATKAGVVIRMVI